MESNRRRVGPIVVASQLTHNTARLEPRDLYLPPTRLKMDNNRELTDLPQLVVKINALIERRGTNPCTWDTGGTGVCVCVFPFSLRILCRTTTEWVEAAVRRRRACSIRPHRFARYSCLRHTSTNVFCLDLSAPCSTPQPRR